MLSLPELVLAILIVAIGTAVQASIGFGLAMIAAPLLLLVDAALVPGPLIAVALALSLWMAWRDRHAIDLGHLRLAMAGRVLGTLPAALLLGSISATTFDLLFGTLVLLAVLMSILHTSLKPTPLAVFIATAASGFMGTISSIGGPPLALVYQNVNGAELRANLAMLFVLGTIVSLIALSAVGRFGVRDIAYSGLMLGGVILGVLCSGPLQTRVDRSAARPYLLGLCFLSACGVLLRAAWQLSD